MRPVAAVFAFVVASGVACTSSPSGSSSAPDEKASVESTTTAFHNALRINDSTALYSFIDDDVVMMPPGETPVHGLSAMRTWYSGFLGQYQTSSLTLDNKEVLVGNGWATETGSYAWGLKPTAGGAEIVDRGHYMQIWKRAADGHWKFYREIWNSAAPPS